jgi:hypothetical protein
MQEGSMDRAINLVALAISIAAIVPLFFAQATANVTRRRILSAVVIAMLFLIVGNQLWTRHVEEKEAQRKAAEAQERINFVKKDIVRQLKKSRLTYDQMSIATNDYDFADKNEAIDQLRKEEQIDSTVLRLKDAQGEYLVKVWHVIETK